ncbi:MAG: DUF6544 family protein [Stellaceae bacterium]
MQEQVRGLLERIRRCAMPEGDIDCRGTWLRQHGEMRLAPDRPWLPFQAEEWFAGGSIDFRWRAWVRMAPLVAMRVADSFQDGRGALTASVFGILPIARSRGSAIDQGEALRGLAELPWRPFAFREAPCLTWEAAGGDRLRATFDDGRTRVSAEFEVDADGHVLGGTANRPRTNGKSVVDTKWSGCFRDYRMLHGLRVPTVAEATWHLPEGPFTYWRGRITEFSVLA